LGACEFVERERGGETIVGHVIMVRFAAAEMACMYVCSVAFALGHSFSMVTASGLSAYQPVDGKQWFEGDYRWFWRENICFLFMGVLGLFCARVVERAEGWAAGTQHSGSAEAGERGAFWDSVIPGRQACCHECTQAQL
jgi:hypothetical protein